MTGAATLTDLDAYTCRDITLITSVHGLPDFTPEGRRRVSSAAQCICFFRVTSCHPDSRCFFSASLMNLRCSCHTSLTCSLSERRWSMDEKTAHGSTHAPA
jgi:hypothetical protein